MPSAGKPTIFILHNDWLGIRLEPKMQKTEGWCLHPFSRQPSCTISDSIGNLRLHIIQLPGLKITCINIRVDMFSAS
jgi:hypothetical protein